MVKMNKREHSKVSILAEARLYSEAYKCKCI